MSQPRFPYQLYIILAAILWAFDGILRRSLFDLPAPTIVFYEHLIGSLILLPITLNQIIRLKLSFKTWLAIIWVALFSGVTGTLLFTQALLQTNFIPFSVVFLLQKLQPLFAIITARLVLQEKPQPRFLQWAIIALIAAYFVTFPGGQVNFNSDPKHFYAALLALGAAFAWGSSTAFSKLGLAKLPYLVMTCFRFLIATPIAFAAVTLLNQSNTLSQLTLPHLGKLTLIALSTGMVALAIYYKGLKQTKASHSTILELTFPLLAVFIDIFLYHTTLAPSQYLAAIILVFSIYQVSRLKS